MNLRKATIDELKAEYERLRPLITGNPNWKDIIKQREDIVKEVRRRGLNPHGTIT